MSFKTKNCVNEDLRHAGEAAGLPPDTRSELAGAALDTRDFEGMQVILAINYGGRDEIGRAVRRLLAAGGAGFASLAEKDIAACLDNPDVPDADLIIRSAGEYRTSNFLLWEGAYAELYVSPRLWPDWSGEDLAAAVSDYQNRDRRFGGVTVK